MNIFFVLIKNDEYFFQILDSAIRNNPSARYLWEEKLLLSRPDDNKMLSMLQEANKSLKPDDLLHLWMLMLDNVESSDSVGLKS